MVFEVSHEKTAKDREQFLQLVDEMIHHARNYDSQKAAELLRFITPNYTSADLPENVRGS